MANDSESARTTGDGGLSIRIASSIGAFTRERMGQPRRHHARRSEAGYNPFLSYRFSDASSRSPAAPCARTGWQGHHLRLEDADGALLGAVPCYLKSHSQGEYVFDHGWADAFERAGGSYYPKLQASVPFTPVTGPRLLVAASARTRRRSRPRLPPG